MHIMMTVNKAWNVWNFRLCVVRALLNDGHTITVLAPKDESVENLLALGCQFYDLDMSVKGLNPFQDLNLTLRFLSIFKETQPDVILSYTIKNNIFGALAAKRARIPFIPNVTGLGTAFLSGGILQGIAQGLYRFAFRDLPVIFFQNTDDRDLFVSQKLIQKPQARCLPGSGIDLEYYSPKPLIERGDTAVFLMIARLLKDKGVYEFVEAARLTKMSFPNVRFQILGAIGYENRTAIPNSEVQDWISKSTIEYLGTTSDVRPFIEAATCVVLPSYREGAPRTLIEAAAMARPIITTDVAGCRDIINKGITGLLCEARDSNSLVRAIRCFLNLSHSERARMGVKGQKKMEQEFDENIIVRRYLSAISDSVDF